MRKSFPGRIAARWVGPTALLDLSRIAVVLLVSVWSGRACGQRFEARLFGQQDGLDNLAVSAIAQDGKGFLWVASQNGIFRYDGARFQSFGAAQGITDSGIFSLLVDRGGTLWVGSHNGLFWFDGTAFHELRYMDLSLRVGANSMMTVASNGELVVATPKGLYSIEPSKAARDGSRGWAILPYRIRHPSFPGIEDMNGIGTDALDRFWIGCGDAICGFNDRSAGHGAPVFQRLGPDQGVPPDFYVSFFLARDGSMYARGRKNILKWKQGDQVVTALSGLFPSTAMKTVHRRFTEDAFGRILTPTASGFAAWDGIRWDETIATSQGEIDGASEVFADREGALWIGTAGSGLLESLGYRRWNNYGTTEGLIDPHVFALAMDGVGSLWAGHDKGTSRLRPGATSFTSTALANDPDATQIQALAPSPDGGMWVASLLGHVFHVAANGNTDVRASIDTYIGRIRRDSAGTVWIASSDGLYTLNCQPSRPCSAKPVPTLEKASIHDLVIDAKGAVWATDDKGIVRIERSGTSTSGSSKASITTTITRATMPDAPKVFDLIAAARDGTFWLSSGKSGVYHVRIENSNGIPVAKIAESHPVEELASSEIVSLDLDHAGGLWIGTDHGLNVLDTSKSDGKLWRITEDDGLIWNDVDSRAFLADADGSIWIGTSHGVSHLLDPAAIFDRPPFAAAIDIARYNDRAVPANARVLWDGGVTMFQFAGLTFRDNRELHYRYSLAGFDSTPVDTHSPFVRFQKLPPGTFTFRVVAEDLSHGVISAPAEYTFTLTPPWWRTDTFYTLLALSFCCVVVLIWRWSQRALLAQRSKLQRLVAERTYDLEQLAVRDSLTGLLNRNAIMSALTAEIQNAQKYNSPLCIALIDLDHFKQINDTFGHLAGDEVLRRSAERLQSSIRNSDAIGRYGGEEFLIIFRNVEREFGVERCEVVRRSLCMDPILYGPHRLQVTCSIGMAWSGTTADHLNALVAKADRAMYQAKENGRNRTEFAAAD